MTYEEAIKILHPDTIREVLTEIERYNGFSGREVAIKAIEDACILACKAMEKQQVMAWRPFKFDEDGLLFNIPEEGQEILVTFNPYFEFVENESYVYSDTFWQDEEGYYLESCVEITEDMAWMPLPEPYKRREE